MSKKENGGPAYPGSIACDTSGDILQGEEGMALRDYFAGQALVGMWGNFHLLEAVKKDNEERSPEAIISIMAYDQADAMLKAREK